ncbi:hypothetical protein BCR43DRAFT_430308 [Syncephalastrum racemosum]|uniref:Uncharacterized protein n=1 Tax=Syncephalastrum racemosum TaxID=13706 RepID=A0A1X2HTN6_SYNRA|nr:hypothetical protein BCR43DRAFT_430308 [Syncephalastrum racemosum]
MFRAQPCGQSSDAHFQKISSLSPPFSQLTRAIVPKEKQYYALSGLNLGSSYELRVSYSASFPTDFSLDLLDICKVEDGTVTWIAQIQTAYAGVSHMPGKEHAPVSYNLVLENLYFGFLFHQVYKVVLIIAALLAFGALYLIPRVQREIQSVLIKEKAT